MIFEMNSFVSYVFVFAIVIGIGFLLFALRLVYDHEKMRCQAIDGIHSLRLEIKKIKGEIADNNIGHPVFSYVPVSPELVSFVERIENKERELSKQVSILAKKANGLSLYSRVNILTGEWFTISQTAEVASKALSQYIGARLLEAALVH